MDPRNGERPERLLWHHRLGCVCEPTWRAHRRGDTLSNRLSQLLCGRGCPPLRRFGVSLIINTGAVKALLNRKKGFQNQRPRENKSSTAGGETQPEGGKGQPTGGRWSRSWVWTIWVRSGMVWNHDKLQHKRQHNGGNVERANKLNFLKLFDQPTAPPPSPLPQRGGGPFLPRTTTTLSVSWHPAPAPSPPPLSASWHPTPLNTHSQHHGVLLLLPILFLWKTFCIVPVPQKTIPVSWMTSDQWHSHPI